MLTAQEFTKTLCECEERWNVGKLRREDKSMEKRKGQQETALKERNAQNIIKQLK